MGVKAYRSFESHTMDSTGVDESPPSLVPFSDVPPPPCNDFMSLSQLHEKQMQDHASIRRPMVCDNDVHAQVIRIHETMKKSMTADSGEWSTTMNARNDLMEASNVAYEWYSKKNKNDVNTKWKKELVVERCIFAAIASKGMYSGSWESYFSTPKYIESHRTRINQMKLRIDLELVKMPVLPPTQAQHLRVAAICELKPGAQNSNYRDALDKKQAKSDEKRDNWLASRMSGRVRSTTEDIPSDVYVQQLVSGASCFMRCNKMDETDIGKTLQGEYKGLPCGGRVKRKYDEIDHNETGDHSRVPLIPSDLPKESSADAQIREQFKLKVADIQNTEGLTIEEALQKCLVLPSPVFGRETEYEKLLELVVRAVVVRQDPSAYLNDHSSLEVVESIIASGKSGCGKTSVLEKVCRSLRDPGFTKKLGIVQPITIREMNVVKDKTSVKKLYENMEMGKHKTTFIAVVDEVDLLSNNDLSHLFEMASDINSKFVLVGMCNNLNIEELLPRRLRSKLKPITVPFKPYGADEIQHIVKNRFPGLVEDKAIDLCSRSTSNTPDSDIRLAFRMCQNAAKVASTAGADQVLCKHMFTARNDMLADTSKTHIRQLAPVEKFIIAHLHDTYGLSKEVEIRDAYAHCTKTQQISYSTYNEAIMHLGDTQFVKKREERATKKVMVSLLPCVKNCIEELNRFRVVS